MSENVYSKFSDDDLILRDELAIDRTLLANERTLLAYLRSGVALALGSEGAGLSRLVREKCDLLVRLPMWGKVGPLNVAVAGSIVLHAAKMQGESQNG